MMNTLQEDAATHRPAIGGKRILVVEDETGVRETLKLVLRLDGHAVVEAANGREACHLFAPGDFDLVITDYIMPEMKGDELARTIKCLVPSQPILMLTAFPGEVDGSKNPVDVILEKPFELATLRKQVALLLSVSH
jgi:DNA-binding response OmpR family regulator